MMVFLNSIILFHAIPKALPNDLAAQERLMSYLILGLMVGDVRSVFKIHRPCYRD